MEPRPPATGEQPLASLFRSETRGLVVALGVCLALELAVALRSPLVSRDGLGFIEYATQLLADPAQAMRTHDQHPGYPLLIAATRCLLGTTPGTESPEGWVTAARVPSLVAGLAVVALVWGLTRETFPAPVATLAALLAAMLPLLRQNAADALSDTPHLAAYLLATWCALRGWSSPRGLGWWLATGLASGLAYWIRPEGLTPALVVAGLLVCQIPLADRAERWRLAGAVALVLVSAAALVLPQAMLSGRWASKLTNKPLLVAWRSLVTESSPPNSLPPNPAVSAVSAAVPGPPLALDPPPGAASTITEQAGGTPPSPPSPPGSALPIATRSVAETPPPPLVAVDLPTGPELFARTAPGSDWAAEQARLREALLARSWTEIVWVGLAELLGEIVKGLRYVLIVPLAWAWFGPSRRAAARPAVLVCGSLALAHVALLMTLYYVGGYISHRHVMPWVALMLPWVAAGCWQGATQLIAVSARPAVARLVVATVGVGLVVSLMPRTLRPLNPAFAPLARAADYLRLVSAPGDRLLTNARHVSFLSGLPARVLVEDHLPDVSTALAAPEASYAFVALDIASDINYDRAWLEQLGDQYLLVHRVPGGDASSPHEVAIFARRDIAQRLAHHAAPVAAGGARR